MEGLVKWFNAQKGYGFVTADGKDYFVHYSDINAEGYKTLEDGQKVSFDTKEGPKGTQACNVVLV